MELIDHKANKVIEHLRSGQIQLLSLDIFDTILYRLVPQPIDAFILLGHQLRKKNIIPFDVSATVFAKYRFNAEKRAREKQHFQAQNMEVSLEEIYRCFPKALKSKQSVQKYIEEEIELEKRITCFDPTIIQIVQYAKNNGIQIALTSDTYFSKSGLKKILGDFFSNIDFVFNSCDHRTPKAHKLFDAVLEKTNYAPHTILHIGDKFEADIEPAQSRLIQAVHWFSESPYFEDILKKEVSEYTSEREKVLDETYGDFGFSALRRRIVYHPDIGFPPPDKLEENTIAEDDLVYKSYGGQVIGPILTGFCQWVYQSCQQEGATDLLCLMREGRLFKNMMDITSEGEKYSLKSHEVYVSRYATLKASILYANSEEIFEFIKRPGQLSVKDANQELGLSDSDFKNFTFDLDQLLEHEHHIRQYIQFILSKPKLKQKILDDSTKQRQNFFKHLSSMIDLEKAKKIHLIDIGYAGSIQKKMEKIIKSKYPHIQTVGFYLITNKGIEDLLLQGGHAYGYLTDCGQPISVSHLVTRSPEVLEQCTMADCGSTKGYDETGQPVLGELTIPDNQKQEILWVQQGILAFAKVWKQHYKANLEKASSSLMKTLIQSMIVRSVGEPTLIEATYFGRWFHDDNLTKGQARRLVDFDSISKDIPYFSAHQFASIKPKDAYWIFAIAGYISDSFQKAIKHIFMREVEAENFGAHEKKHDLMISLDTGLGYTEKTSVYSPYKRSSTGCVRHRVVLKSLQQNINSLACFFIHNQDIFQFDTLKIQFISAKGEEKEYCATYEDGSFEKTIRLNGFEKLRDNIFVSNTEEASIIWEPEKQIKNFSGKIIIDFYFSCLELHMPQSEVVAKKEIEKEFAKMDA